jgi:hypothetical protein
MEKNKLASVLDIMLQKNAYATFSLDEFKKMVDKAIEEKNCELLSNLSMRSSRVIDAPEMAEIYVNKAKSKICGMKADDGDEKYANKIVIVEDLIKMANSLDKMNYKKVSGMLDQVIEKLLNCKNC